jgi:hypothetical protein
MGKKKKEKQRKRVSANRWAYNGFFRWNHWRITSVGDSIGDSVGESATSLYGYLNLNPSVIPSVKSSDVTTPLHISRQTVYPISETVGIYRQKYSIGIYRPCRRRVYAVGIYRQILRRKNSVGNFVGFLRFSGNDTWIINITVYNKFS